MNMHRRKSQLLATLPPLLLALYLSAPARGVDKVGSFALACAAREVEVTTLIEDHGNAGDVSPERLAEANRTWMRARAMCYQGRVDEAVALYDGIKTAVGSAQVGKR
jgi:hypothetical protein